MSRKLRIAFIGLRGVPAAEGGIERHVEELGARLADRGHEVTVFCRTNYVRERRDSYRGMALRYVPALGTKHLDFIAHSALASALVLRRAPDIVHYHAIASGLVAPLPRYLSRSRVVLTAHGLDYARQKWTGLAKAGLKLGERMSARVPHATIAVSRALADHYATRLGRRAQYIPNGMPEAVVRPLGDVGRRLGLGERPYFLFVGRLVPEKAPDLLLRAFARLDADARLVVAGSSGFTDAYAESLRVLAAADSRVVLAGGVFGSDLSELYSNAAAFVLPSSLEGLPITLLEAVAHQAPVIVSDIAPHLEIVGGDGAGHRVVPQGDEVALTAALSAVLAAGGADRAGAKALAADAQARFDWDTIVSATEAVYSGVLASEGVPDFAFPLERFAGAPLSASSGSESAETAAAAASPEAAEAGLTGAASLRR